MLKEARLAVVVSLLLGGCSTTHITAYKDGEGPTLVVGSGASVETAYAGAVHYLPMVQFNLTVTRTLAQCSSPVAGGGKPQSNIRFEYKVRAEPSYIPGERFVLDYESISSWTKTGDLTLETYDNGVLKSLNSTVADESAAIAGNLVATGVGIAKLVTGVPSLSVATAPQDSASEWVCTTETVALLDILDKAAKVVETREAELLALAKKSAHLDRLLKLELISEPQKLELAERLSKQEEGEAKLKAA